MSEERLKRVKELQEEILKIKDNMATFSGLSKVQFERYLELAKLIKSKRASIKDKEEFKELDNIKGENGVDKLTQKALKRLYSELADMQYKSPTDDYFAVFNNKLAGKIGTEEPPGIQAFNFLPPLIPPQYSSL